LAVGCAPTGSESASHEELRFAHKSLNQAAQWLGGPDTLRHLPTATIEATGERSILHEGESANDGAALSANFSSVTYYDFDADRVRVDTEVDTVAVFPSSRTYTEIADAEGGRILGQDNIFGAPPRPMLSDRAAAFRKQQRLLNPHQLLRVALADPSIVRAKQDVVIGGRALTRLVLDDATYPISLFIDRRSGEIVELRTAENDPLTRDVALVVAYRNWQRVGATRFPMMVTIRLDGEIVHEEQRSSVVLGAVDESLFDLPPGSVLPLDPELAERGDRNHQYFHQFLSLGLPTADGVQNTVAAVELAPGVFHLMGGTHHSLAVRQESGIVVMEAPLYPERSDALITWAHQQFPGERITHLISSHHHTDHSGGARSFVAEGAAVIMGAASVGFFRREVFRASSTIEPDALESSSAYARILPVGQDGSRTLNDPERPIVTYHIRSGHADDLLVTYLPEQKILFVADVYSPGLPFFNIEENRELHSELVRLGLDIGLIAGAHGATASWAEFEAQIAGTP
jgi:glyoxylase-like metal-dependent hydrolase (beta-lactamase superfamily II)